MLEFSVSNQLLSRLDATKVVADSENYLECAFQFSEDWDGAVAVATFGHSKVEKPVSVRIVEGKCLVPHEVIKTYGFQLSVYGTAEEDGGAVCHIPTNVVTVEVEASGAAQGLAAAEPTKSMYDSLMTAIAAGEKAATEAKVSAQASAGTAQGAANAAEEAAKNAATSAKSCAQDAWNARAVWDIAMVSREVVEAIAAQVRSYVVGSGDDRALCHLKNILWADGTYVMGRLGLEPERRYQVKIDGVWYDAAAQWRLVKESTQTHNDQAELLSAGEDDEVILDPDVDVGDDERPEIPEGDEVTGGGSTDLPDTPAEGGDTGESEETPEVPKGDEVTPGEDSGEGTGGTPVVKPALGHKTVLDIVVLTAGPLTVEDVRVDEEGQEQWLCRFTTQDTTVREVEIRTDGNINAKYFYEQALAAAQRAEAAAERIEACGA